MPTVLIADDSPTLRRIVSTVLERAGYTGGHRRGRGRGRAGASSRNQPDAVILDVQMPRVSGYVAARLLKDDWQTADIPILLLTSLDAASRPLLGRADRRRPLPHQGLRGAPADRGASPRSSQAADEARGGRPPLRPDPVELGDDEVMARVSELLDRKLFEASVAAEVTQIAADVHGFEETVAAVLGVLGRIVDYDLAAVLHARRPRRPT